MCTQGFLVSDDMIDNQVITVTNMLLARGVPTVEAVISHLDLQSPTHYLHLEALSATSGRKVHAFWFREPKVGVRNMRTVLDAHGEDDEFILIARQGATAYTERTVAQGMSQRVAIFREGQVEHDITQHVMVPRHTPCTPEERADVLQKLSCDEGQLATLAYDDPIRRYYNYTPGTLIRIDRFWCNQTFYRVVAGPSLPSSS